MARYQRYSQEFKDAIVSKIINRGEDSIAQVCAKEGVNQSSAYSWLNRDIPSDMKKKNPKTKKWSAKDKLKAVSDTAGLSEVEIGAYLRKEGLHSQQLEEWRNQVLSSLTSSSKPTDAKDERDARIKELEREVLRKDKALAEASALLILQKKVNLIWGDGDPK